MYMKMNQKVAYSCYGNGTLAPYSNTLEMMGFYTRTLCSTYDLTQTAIIPPHHVAAGSAG